jgi:hypothetical protein
MGRLRTLVQAAIAALDAVTPGRLFLVAVLLGLIVLHGLVPSSFTVDGVTLGLVGVLVIAVLVPLLKSATLPGGAGLEFRSQLDELQQVAEAVKESPAAPIDTHDASSGGVTGESRPDQHATGPATIADSEGVDAVTARILDETSRSPKVGLMVLAAEVERATRQILAGIGRNTPDAGRSLSADVRRLVQLEVVSPSLASAVDLFMSIRNQVVHGRQRVTDDEVLRAVDAGLTILTAVEAIPRERHFVAAANVPVFHDKRLMRRIDDANGILLRSVSPGGVSEMLRIFPTTRTDYEVGREVAWEWNVQRQWGPAWYRDENTEVREAWTGSLEFVGRHLDEL